MLDQFFKNLDDKLNQINEKIDNIQVDKKIEILDVSDIMKILKCNRNTVNNIFKMPDFPAIKGIKSNKIEKQAFYNWLQRKGIIKK